LEASEIELRVPALRVESIGERAVFIFKQGRLEYTLEAQITVGSVRFMYRTFPFGFV
jgi:hypothetical protein